MAWTCEDSRCQPGAHDPASRETASSFPGPSASPRSLRDLMPRSRVVDLGIRTWDERGCQNSLCLVAETVRRETAAVPAIAPWTEEPRLAGRPVCPDVCGAGPRETRGRWPREWRGEGRAGRASEEETVPHGGRLGTGDSDSGAEQSRAGAGGGGERSA